eukprot:11543533-Ditylum_brightwellii.AAC.1
MDKFGDGAAVETAATMVAITVALQQHESIRHDQEQRMGWEVKQTMLLFAEVAVLLNILLWLGQNVGSVYAQATGIAVNCAMGKGAGAVVLVVGAVEERCMLSSRGQVEENGLGSSKRQVEVGILATAQECSILQGEGSMWEDIVCVGEEEVEKKWVSCASGAVGRSVDELSSGTTRIPKVYQGVGGEQWKRMEMEDELDGGVSSREIS